MCFERKQVNVDTQFVNDFATTKIDVSCGKCPDCRWRRYNDYLVRCYFEFEKVAAKRSEGAFAIFETLTHREDKLPKFEGVPCFCSDDINKFIKRLKEHWRNKLGHPLEMSYIIVSEYGGKRGRPHYHPIFFVFEKIDLAEFLESVYLCWGNGKTDFIDTLGRKYLLRAKSHVLTSVAAIRYILKYLFKYADFDREFDTILSKLSDRYDVDKAFAMHDYFMYHCRPFIRCSVGFGLPSDLDFLSPEGRVRVPNGRGFDDLPAARYIIRKLCCQKVALLVNDTPILRPNGNPVWLRTDSGSYVYMKSEFGVQYSLNNLPRLLSKTAVTYKQVIDTLPDYIRRAVYSFLSGRKLRDLAVYNIVYHGCVCDKFYLHFTKSVFDPETYNEFYRQRLSRNPQAKPEKDISLTQLSLVQEHSCTEFESFDYILNIIRCQMNVLFEHNSDKPGKIDSYNRLHSVFGDS